MGMALGVCVLMLLLLYEIRAHSGCEIRCESVVMSSSEHFSTWNHQLSPAEAYSWIDESERLFQLKHCGILTSIGRML